MNQAEVSKLVSRLKIHVKPKPGRIKNVDGPKGRLEKLRKTVTALVKHERIELNFNRANEARSYAERLISDAIRYGDCHNQTMKMADFWLIEKQLVHKLFKVLVPRYENYNISYTRLIAIPRPPGGYTYDKSVLELRGNPYPPMVATDKGENRNLLHNILLEEARKEKRQEQYLLTAQALGSQSQDTSTNWAATTPTEPPAASAEKS